MKRKKSKIIWKRLTNMFLASVLTISGISVPAFGAEAEKAEENVIEISTAEDLAKIGMDNDYPLYGDYRLTADIDLKSRSWTPIGGERGTRGGTSFTGTFDGNGHVISNLQMASEADMTGSEQWGLFGMIGSDAPDDASFVKNLILTDADIDIDKPSPEKENDYLSVGALAGAANRNAVIENVAVIGGTVKGNCSNAADTVGVGGLVGEMRGNATEGDNGVTVRNVYVGADVEAGSSSGNNYAAGVIGRIAYQKPASVTGCVFTGTVLFKGKEGYGISGGDVTGNIGSCYYLSGKEKTGEKVSEDSLKSGTLLPGLDAAYWEAQAGSFPAPKLCGESELAQEALAWEGLSFQFSEGDSFSSITGSFIVPLTLKAGHAEEEIEWTDAGSGTFSVGADGTVTIRPVFVDQECFLIARTASGLERQFKFLVKSTAKVQIDQEYASVGTPLTASVPGAPDNLSFRYEWSADGVKKGTENSYTPQEEDLEKTISVTATAYEGSELRGSCGSASLYFSKLPVVYIDTEDGSGITSKTDYKKASMRIQGNDALNSGTTTLYDGEISIRGRGNSTWNLSYSKLPYKLKLDKKTGLFGFEKSKHWALLANYMDESLLRNKTSYDLAEKMGIGPHLPSEHVEVILNGAYAGTYQLVGNVRVEPGRVDIQDWEGAAGDAAKKIAKAKEKEGIEIDQDGLEDFLNENMQWITSDLVTFDGQTYRISDYYAEIPKTADGRTDVSGGFLFELDSYFDEISKFLTQSNQPIMFKSPEFAAPSDSGKFDSCEALSRYARQYVQAVEDAVRADDFYTDVKKEEITEQASNFTEDYEGKRHYSELLDTDSFVRYLLLNELYWNTETMKKSTYMYKDLGGKLYIGPVWDMDWTSNSIVSEQETSDYRSWVVRKAQDGAQAESWYRYLVRDPYFVGKLLECYQENRQNFEDIVKQGGVIDQKKEYLKEAAAANFSHGYVQHNSDFETEAERLRTFLNNRLAWMDDQFADFQSLLSSIGRYKPSSSISVSADTGETGATTYEARVTDAGIKKVAFYINGILAGTADVANQAAVLVAEDQAYLEKKEGAFNLVQVRATDTSEDISNFARFQKDLPEEKPPISGTASISGEAEEGSVLTATVTGDHAGELRYQWKADGEPIEGATSESYRLTEREIGKRITVEVTCETEEGILESAPTEKVKKKSEEKPPISGTASISGEAEEGSVLTATVTGDHAGKLSYQWKADGEPIEGATSESYRLTEREIGKRITVEVTCETEEGILSSAPTEKVEKKPEEKPDPVPAPKPDQKLVNSVKSLIQSASAKKAADYTKESYQKLLAAKAKAESALKTSDSQAISRAMTELKKAIEGLVKAQPQKQAETEKKIPKKGETFRYKNATYKVLSSSASGGTAMYVKPVKKTYTKAVVPAIAKSQEISFKVTKIGSKAFKDNRKLKHVTIGKYVKTIGTSAFAGDKRLTGITVKSDQLTKVEKNALKGVNAKCKIRVPKKKIAKYKKLFRKKGQKSSVKVGK